jgi:hypothetical protein
VQRSTQAGRSAWLASALLRIQATVRRKIGANISLERARASGRRAQLREKVNNETNVIYHYTNIDSALSILKNKIIWASCCDYFNDYSEITSTILGFKDFILLKEKNAKGTEKKHIEKMLSYYYTNPSEKKKQIFVTSFSKKHDLLSQWRGYADDGFGLAIGFDINTLGFEIIKSNTGIVNFDKYLIEVEYSEKEKESFFEYLYQYSIVDGFWIENKPTFYNIENALESIVDFNQEQIRMLNTFNILEGISPTFKDVGFFEENEWRIIRYAQVSSYINEIAPIDFDIRSNGRAMIPFFNIPFSANTVKEIVIGPKADYKKIYYALKMIESKYEYSYSIIPSKIPYSH